MLHCLSGPGCLCCSFVLAEMGGAGGADEQRFWQLEMQRAFEQASASFPCNQQFAEVVWPLGLLLGKGTPTDFSLRPFPCKETRWSFPYEGAGRRSVEQTWPNSKHD